jgi:hypothetical protein
MENDSDFPEYIKDGRAILFLDEKAHQREWYILFADQFDQWHAFGLPTNSPYHRLGYLYLWGQVDYLTADLPCHIHTRWHGSLPDGTKIIRIVLARDGITFLCCLWQRHLSWRRQEEDFADIPF